MKITMIPFRAFVSAIFLLPCLFSEKGASQILTNDTLAIVGNDAITVKQFLPRYELMPWFGKENKARVETTKL